MCEPEWLLQLNYMEINSEFDDAKIRHFQTDVFQFICRIYAAVQTLYMHELCKKYRSSAIRHRAFMIRQRKKYQEDKREIWRALKTLKSQIQRVRQKTFHLRFIHKVYF